MKKIISIVALFFMPFVFGSLPFGKGWGWASAQSIDSVEYFFDADPGNGNANSYSVTPTDSITDSLSFNFPGLGPGFHTLNFRVRTTNGVWSLYESHTFFLNDTIFATQASFDSSSAEYFYDQEPGVGNGTALLLAPGDSLLDTAFAITAGLTPGFHNLYIRAKDSNNVWSLYEGGKFYLYDTLVTSALPVTHPLAAAEYFYDTDPGVGNGIAMNSFTPADSILLSDSLLTATLAVGTHNLFVRVKDTMNVWSLYEGRSFVVCNFVPVADFSADTVCLGKSTTFTDLSTGIDTSSSYTYGWDFSNNGTIDDTTKGNTSHTYFTSGTHTVSLIVNNTNGCIDTIRKTIYIDSIPSATFTLPVDTVCKDDTLTLSGGSPAGGVYSGTGVIGGILYCDSTNAGINTITYTYYNSDSCSVSVTDNILVSKCTGIQEHDLTGYTISLNPNPFRTETVLSLQHSQNEYRNMRFALFDVFGKKILDLQIDSPTLKIDRRNIPSGIYLYKLIGKNGDYNSGKLVAVD